MITSRVFISGVEYDDAREVIATKSVSDDKISANYTVLLDSPFGRHKDDFTVNNEIKIFGGPFLDGLRLYYPLNEGAGSRAGDFFGVNNGSIVSGLNSRWVSGILGSAYQFGSPTYIEQSGLNPANFDKLSVSFWVYPNQWEANHRLIDQQNVGPENGFTFASTAGTTGSIQWSIRSGATATTAINIATPNNQWTHVVGTQDNIRLQAKVYTNGSLRGTDNSSFMSQITGDVRLAIGKRTTTNANYFSGLIDDLKIHNRILSEQEVASMYNSGVGLRDLNLITGIVEDIQFEGDGTRETIKLSGRDYTARLQDVTVNPSVYTNTEVGSIVRDIVSNYTNNITYSGVQTTTTTLKRIAFNQIPVYDALMELALLSNSMFYINEEKDLKFEPIGSKLTGVTLGSGKIINMTLDTTREGMANRVWVYGDRQLAGFTEVLPVGSPNVGGLGSVFTLINKPHNTLVNILGSPQQGGIFELNATPASGAVYLVSFQDRQLIFPSGTTFGYYLPPSGGSIVATYDRDIPIAKAGENTTSIVSFGPREKIILDKSIKDPTTATAILNKELEKSSPLNNIELNLKGWYDFSPGQLVNVSLGNFSLSESGVPIIEANYNFNPQSVNQENVINLKLDKRILDLTDKIKNLKDRLESLEADSRTDLPILPRLITSTGSALIIGSRWEIKTRYLGSEFILWGSDNFGPKGSGGTPTLGLLFSGAGITGSDSYLASGALSPLVSIISGGYSGY